MKIETFTSSHLEEALELFQKTTCHAFPFLESDDTERKVFLRKIMENLSSEGLGLVAMEEAKMLGFLLSYQEESPLGAGSLSLLRKEQKESLLQAMEESLKTAGCSSYSLTLPVEDYLECLGLGFTIEKFYAMKHIQGFFDSHIQELPPEDYLKLQDLRNAFVSYLEGAPIYQKFTTEEKENWFLPDGKRIFVIKEDAQYKGFFAVRKEGETYLAKESKVWNSAGFYLDPELRGKGMASLLLSSVEEELKKQGIDYLGTSYAATNVNGKRFWEKSFTPYAVRLYKSLKGSL